MLGLDHHLPIVVRVVAELVLVQVDPNPRMDRRQPPSWHRKERSCTRASWRNNHLQLRFSNDCLLAQTHPTILVRDCDVDLWRIWAIFLFVHSFYLLN